MKTKHSRIGVIFSVLLLACLLVAAFYVPGVVSRAYDSRTLGQINTQRMELSTYQVTYGSFEEKLYAISSALAEGGELILLEAEDVALPDTGVLTQETVLQEADRLLKEELQLGYNVSDSYKVVDAKQIGVVCRNGQGEALLPENQVYLLSCICTEISIEAVTDYPELYYAIPHMTLWVDAEFGKLYGVSLVNVPKESVELSKGDWGVDYKEVLIRYWGLGQEYELGGSENSIYDSYEEKEKQVSWGEEVIFMGQDAYLRVYLETLWYETSIDLRLGMPPFIYGAYEMGHTIAFSD